MINFALPKKIIFAFCLGVFLIGFVSQTFARETIYLPCKKLPDGITRQSLENHFKTYDTTESAFILERVLSCKDALPLLKKHALDPNPEIRKIVSNALSRAFYDFNRSFYPEVFKLLVLQLENFPSEEYSLPVAYSARYGCYHFEIIDARRLTDALIRRIRFRNSEFNRDEIDLLGCLSRRESRAKGFLLEMHQPEFQTGLNEIDRQQQREYLRFPLAEAGVKEMEDKLLDEINDLLASGDSEKIQNSLPGVRSFTNRRIVARFIELLNDRREITVANYGSFSEGYKRTELKVGLRDYMVRVFTAAYGRRVTGEYDGVFRVHTDAEIGKVYRRVKSFAERKVYVKNY